MEEQREKAILIGIDDGTYDAEHSIGELGQLADTAGAETLFTAIQQRTSPDGATFIGIGKLFEIKEIAEANGADLLIFDGELTPTQQRNIEKLTDIRTIDRTTLILDIFALNAKSGAGKLQVELAQLNYMLPRLGGKGTELSRLGGGIGTRGPGESKLESDRRHIRRRIKYIEEELKRTEKNRALIRSSRKKRGVVTVAVVGYTNAGKSTLLNALTDAGVLAQDKLFATLDPTSRALKLPDGRSVMLIDTVGFISRLPHTLVEAFKSTLEEAAGADLILNVCDASDPHFDEHLRITRDILTQLGAGSTPEVTVLNKCDACADVFMLPFGRHVVRISALQKKGLGELLDEISKALPDTVRRVELLVPYTDGGAVSALRELGRVEKEEYTEDGVRVTALIDARYLSRFEKYGKF
ncbi:MAG: GTPase HflX [Clostridia bacterium]|nr:GTPase HflX [Clostridia bacterium]